MRRLTYLIHILLLCCIILLTGCQNTADNTDYTESLTPSNANMLIGGNLCSFDGSTYYCSGNTLYKIANDRCTSIKRFTLRKPYEISAVDNYIFFKLGSGLSPNSYLYRISATGGLKKTVVDSNVDFYTVCNGRIYYTIAEDETNKDVYVCDINGDNKVLLIDGCVSSFVCYDDCLFYSEGNTVYKYDTTSRISEVIVESDGLSTPHIAVNNNVIYYCTTYQNGSEEYSSLNQTDITTKETRSLYTDEYCGFIHITDDNRLIFRGSTSYLLLDLKTATAKPILEEYEYLSGLYVYGNSIYFNTVDYKKNGPIEEWHSADINSLEVTDIG